MVLFDLMVQYHFQNDYVKNIIQDWGDIETLMLYLKEYDKIEEIIHTILFIDLWNQDVYINHINTIIAIDEDE